MPVAMPSFSELLGPLLGFLFTTATLLFLALTAKWTDDREDLTGLDLPPAPPASPATVPPAGPSEPPAAPPVEQV